MIHIIFIIILFRIVCCRIVQSSTIVSFINRRVTMPNYKNAVVEHVLGKGTSSASVQSQSLLSQDQASRAAPSQALLSPVTRSQSNSQHKSGPRPNLAGTATQEHQYILIFF
jgi:hypothetical protein